MPQRYWYFLREEMDIWHPLPLFLKPYINYMISFVNVKYIKSKIFKNLVKGNFIHTLQVGKINNKPLCRKKLIIFNNFTPNMHTLEKFSLQHVQKET